MKRKPGRIALLILCLGLVQCSPSTTNNPGVPTAFATVRVDLTGHQDTSFGGTGIVTTGVDTSLNDFALALAIQTDNKLVVAGSNGLAGQGQIALLRYNSNGSLDTAFGALGIVKTQLATPALASALAIQGDGKIVAAALLFTSTTASPTGLTTSMTVLRYNTDGSLDTSFGTQGVAAPTPIGTGLASDTCAMLQQSGKFVVAGAAQDGTLVLARYDSTGALDTTFGTSGKTTTALAPPSLSPTHNSPAMAAQSDGRIIVAGRNNNDQAVLRYSVDGSQDTGFGGALNGVVITDIGGGLNYANAVAIQTTGMGALANLDKIVVAGHANVSTSTSDISVARYSKDGVLDTANFGNPSGFVITDILNLGGFDNALGIALQDVSPAEPKILVSGNTQFNGVAQTAMLRYNADGTGDTTFGSRAVGVVLVPIVGPSTIASGNAIVIQAGAIVVTGYD